MMRKTSASLRTVKSFGSDAPVLVSTPKEANASKGGWWQESRSPGRSRISRKAIARGKSEYLRWTCMLACAFVFATCTQDRGYSAYPAFPAPLHVRGTRFQTSGASHREDIGVCKPRCLKRESEKRALWSATRSGWAARTDYFSSCALDAGSPSAATGVHSTLHGVVFEILIPGTIGRHCEERQRRLVRRSSTSEGGSNPWCRAKKEWIASLRSQ